MRHANPTADACTEGDEALEAEFTAEDARHAGYLWALPWLLALAGIFATLLLSA